MNNLVIRRSQLVEAVIVGTPTTGLRYKFTEIPNLSRNNIILYGVEAYSAAELSVSPSGKTSIAAADVVNITVTLKDSENLEFVYQMPLYDLIRSNNAGFITILQPRLINLTDCYIELNATSGISAGEVVLFNFFYDFATV